MAKMFQPRSRIDLVANNLKQLNTMLMKSVRKAMAVASDKMLEDMYEETAGFYTKAEPKQYERTGALGDTPRVTSLNQDSNSVSFDAYLDTSHQYTTGSTPTMEDVLKLANDGIPFITQGGHPARPTVGKRGFWDDAKKKMEITLEHTIGKFFD